jgi:hypothetical protein
MRPGFTCVPKHTVAGIVAAAVLLLFVPLRAGATDDASVGYETIRPALVKVWAFDRSGRPSESGTGVIVDAGPNRALVLTATHVVAGAATIRIDVSRDVHDLVARVERTGPRDLTLLEVERGGLHAAHFAPRSRAVIEGNLVAVAGYVKNDELIGIVGQEPRILFPGTVSSRPDDGRYLELENVHIEEGLSGGAVFDPATGDVLGIITARTTDRRGGFADSGAAVVLPFLAADHIAAAQPPAPARSVVIVSAPPPVVHRAPVAPPPAVPAPLSVIGQVGAKPASLPVYSLRPEPAVTLAAQLAFMLPPQNAIVSWQSAGGDPKRFVIVRSGCRIAVTIDVQTLQFVIAHQALVSPHRRGELLSIALQQRAGTNAGCDDANDVEPTDGAYDPTAMSFNGKHVTMRFVYAGDPDNQALFPSDASLDADLDGSSATATLQFFDRDWNGSIAVPLAATRLAAVSSTW